MTASNGIIAVCSVIFDLDKGQTIEDIYPPGSLSEGECQRVAFHALPVRPKGFRPGRLTRACG